MLKLLVFAPCEKVIVGEEDHLTSMIGLIEGFKVQVIKELPADAIIPLRFSVCTLWRRQEEVKSPQEYEQLLKIIRPDGVAAGEGLTPFTVSNQHIHFRNVTHMPAFPIGLPGIYQLKLFIRQTGEENEWSEAAEYPLDVNHEISPESAEPAAEEN
jgi:hypothetical protein